MTRVYFKLFLIFCTALLITAHEITIHIALLKGLHFDSNLKHYIKDRTVLCDTARVLTSSAIRKSPPAFILSPQRNIQVEKVEIFKLINDELTVGWVVLQNDGKPPLVSSRASSLRSTVWLYRRTGKLGNTG